jgi:hypothetical protein
VKAVFSGNGKKDSGEGKGEGGKRKGEEEREESLFKSGSVEVWLEVEGVRSKMCMGALY